MVLCSFFISNRIKSTKDKTNVKALKNIQSLLSEKAKEYDYSLDLKTSEIKARNKKVVTKCFHKAGIVVPVDDNDVGYRPLPMNDGRSCHEKAMIVFFIFFF